MDYHFKPLFTMRPATDHEAQHEQFVLGRIDVQVPTGSLDKEWGHLKGSADTSAELQARGQEILRTAEAMRQLSTLMTRDEVMKSSNGSLSTLESEEMLSSQEASKLSATNAPLMRPFQRLPPDETVRSPEARRVKLERRRTTW